MELTGEDLLGKETLSKLPQSTSPSKRKIDFVDDSKDGDYCAGSKLVKLEESGQEKQQAANWNEDGVDSDIEVLSETSNSDRSIEVVFDKKKLIRATDITTSNSNSALPSTYYQQDKPHPNLSNTSCLYPSFTALSEYDSQNLALALDSSSAGIDSLEQCHSSSIPPPTQPQRETNNVNNKNEKRCLRSPSLLSMPDSSDDVVCKEYLSASSSFDEKPSSQGAAESTIAATQVEMLCNKSAAPIYSQQPNIRSLLDFPINTSSSSVAPPDSSKSPCPESTNLHSTSFSDSYQGFERAPKNTTITPTSEVIEAVCSPLEGSPTSESQIDYFNTQSANTSAVSIPHFDTPSQPDTSVSQEKSQESVFIKRKKAAENKIYHEQNLVKKLITEEEKENILNTPLSSCDSSAIINSHLAKETKQTTPVASSQSSCSSDASFLFSQKGNKKKTQEPSKKTYAEDSDGEKEIEFNTEAVKKLKRPILCPLDKEKEEELKKTSTPNSSDVSPNISAGGQSSIDKTSNVTPSNTDTPLEQRQKDNEGLQQDKMSSSETRKAEGSSEGSTEESSDVHNYFTGEDLKNAKLEKLGSEVHQLLFTLWKDRATGALYRTYEARNKEEIVLWPQTFWQNISHLSIVVKTPTETAKDRRFSDVSSISRTTSMSGYLGDKSSSDSLRLESTRLSMISTSSLLGSSPKEKDEEFFIPPKNVPSKKLVASSAANNNDDITIIKNIKISNEPESSSSTSETPIVVAAEITPSKLKESSSFKRPPRGKSRVGGRGRGKRSKREIDESFPSSLSGSENKTSSIKSSLLPSPSTPSVVRDPSLLPAATLNTLNKDIYSVLSNSEKLLLKAHPVVYSDEEEAIFLRQCKISEEAKKNQSEYVKSHVREATIECNSVIFARYLDRNYYSAIVIKKADNDKWQVRYTLDNCVSEVREVNILPTSILPRGLCCWVKRPNTKPQNQFSDVGIVKGHCINDDGVLLHIIDVNRGTIIRAPHSHIYLKTNVADDLLERRRNYCSMTASPGANVSLDNIVHVKRRRGVAGTVVSVSPSNSSTTSPLVVRSHKKKADVHLDTSADDNQSSNIQNSTKTSLISSTAAVVSDAKKKITESSSSSSDYEQPLVEVQATSSKSITPQKTPKRTPVSKVKRPSKTSKSTSVKKLIQDAEVEESPLKIPLVQLAKLPEEKEQITPKKRGRKPSE